MRLLVARHGATQHNLEARFTGQIDAPLSELGLLQAKALADRLAPLRFDAIVSSDLIRARVTAECIARRHGEAVQYDSDLREIHLGEWEGQSIAAVRLASPELSQRVECDPTGETAPPAGESWAHFTQRIDEARARWAHQFPDGYVLWVAHGGVMSALLLRALRLDFAQRMQFARGNTSLLEIDYQPRGPVILRVNDTAHLEGMDSATEGERFQAL